MSISENDKTNAVLQATKIAEAAVSNCGQLALNSPESVSALIENVTAKIQELMEKGRSGK